MRTILTIAEQEQFLSDNWKYSHLSHKWSSRGMGNSRILCGINHDSKEELSYAGGCGYDRYGKALGDAVTHMLGKEVLALAKREYKVSTRNRKGSIRYYGLFYNAVTGEAHIDGSDVTSKCVERILHKIGFSLLRVGEHEASNNGEVFYSMTPITKAHRKWY